MFPRSCSQYILVATVLCSLGLAAYAASKKKGISGLSLSGGASDDKPLRSQPWPSTNNKHVLVCGGAGYIGTHTIVSLLESGYDVTVVDNLLNANEEGLRRVREISQCSPDRIRFYNVDLCDADRLEQVFQDSGKFSACIHFAGLKAVGESVAQPLRYYENNLCSTLRLLKLMDKYGCCSIVFSSSATVYGSAQVPITEETQTGLGITNAYGRTKFMIEEILKDFKRSKAADLTKAEDPWRVVLFPLTQVLRMPH
jgi:UDP-glucose 4-epimerase